jgi:hypothetical protein
VGLHHVFPDHATDLYLNIQPQSRAQTPLTEIARGYGRPLSATSDIPPARTDSGQTVASSRSVDDALQPARAVFKSSYFIAWALQHNKEASYLFARSNHHQEAEELKDTMTNWLFILANYPEAYDQTKDARLIRQGQGR